VVSEARRVFTVRWHIAGIDNPADFLYWAAQYGARYELRPAPKPWWLEFLAKDGVHGEYPNGLFWDSWSHPNPARSNFRATHKLTQHGLDGLPRQCYESLARQDPIFRVESRSGLFVLTLDEWLRYFVSGRNSSNLSETRGRAAETPSLARYWGRATARSWRDSNPRRTSDES